MRLWTWATTDDSLAAAYTMASFILGGTFTAIVAFVVALTTIVSVL